MTKKYFYISLFITLFFSSLFFVSSSSAGTINFKLENTKGVPQPIEVREDLGGGDLSRPTSGFHQVNVAGVRAGKTYYITRSYWPGAKGKVAPEKQGLKYTVPENYPSVVEKTVSPIPTIYKPLPVRDVERGIMGEINDRRANRGLNELPRHPALDQVASVWAQSIFYDSPGYLNPDAVNPQLHWNFPIGGRVVLKFGILVYTKAGIIQQIDDNNMCGDIKCRELLMSPYAENMSVGRYADVALVIFHQNCQYNCNIETDFGDSSLLTDQLVCSGCYGSSIKKDPEIKLSYFKNNLFYKSKKRFFEIRAACHKNAKGRAFVLIKKRGKKVKILGKRTKGGFVFKARKIKLKKKGIRLNRRSKVLLVFKGKGVWSSRRVSLN